MTFSRDPGIKGKGNNYISGILMMMVGVITGEVTFTESHYVFKWGTSSLRTHVRIYS